MSDENAFLTSYVVDDDILVLQLHGKLDDSTAVHFNEEIERLCDAGQRKVIIDCAHLRSISSMGIASLVRLQAKLRRDGGEVKLATIHSIVADVFKIVHLDKLFEMYGDIEFARESFYE